MTQTAQTPSIPPSTAKRRKLAHLIADFDTINNDGEEPLSSSPPAPTASRTDNHDQDHTTTQIQILRSSPEIPHPDDPSAASHLRQPPSDKHNHHPSSSPPPSDPDSPIKPLATPKLKTSRFRHPSAPSSFPQTQPSTDQHQHQPYPSFQSRLLGTTSTSTLTALRSPQPSLDLTLPDAFSPSRRRGQKAYIPTGHAETVRGWVLDVAARAGPQHAQGAAVVERGRDAPGGQMRAVVDVLHRDRDGRCAIVRLADPGPSARPSGSERSDALVWMLVNTDAQQRSSRMDASGSGSKLDRLQPGVGVVVRGGDAMQWTVDYDRTVVGAGGSSDSLGGGGSLVGQGSEGGKDTSTCHVAVLWDVVRE